MAPLAGCTPEGLAKETLTNASQWNFLAKVESLKTRPALVITSDDGLAPSSDALAAALRAAGDQRVTAPIWRQIIRIPTSALLCRLQSCSGWHR
jgi:hypothetical protein